MRIAHVALALSISLTGMVMEAGAAHPGRYDGADDEFWDKFSVVVVEIASFDADSNRATAEVLGVAATNHMILRTITVQYEPSRGWSNIFSPRKGDLYMLCVGRDRSRWKLYDSTFAFMEGGRGAKQIESMEDQSVSATMKRIREARLQCAERRGRGQ